MKIYKYLLIDDDIEESELLQLALVDVGEPFEHDTKENGVEAINFLKTTKDFIPDFIFLDINIPLIDGKECLQEIRALEHLSNTAIVIYSSISDKEFISEMEDLGATFYIIKPRRVSALVKILRALLYKNDLPFLVN